MFAPSARRSRPFPCCNPLPAPLAVVPRLSPLSAALPRHHVVLSKHATLSPLFATLTNFAPASPFLATLTKNTRVAGICPATSRASAPSLSALNFRLCGAVGRVAALPSSSFQLLTSATCHSTPPPTPILSAACAQFPSPRDGYPAALHFLTSLRHYVVTSAFGPHTLPIACGVHYHAPATRGNFHDNA
jgi:hypothetical protein